MLALIGQIPVAGKGKSYFQDSTGVETRIDAEKLFASASVRCVKVRRTEDAPVALVISMAAALDHR